MNIYHRIDAIARAFAFALPACFVTSAGAGTLTAQAQVSAACTIGAGSVAFGNYDPVSVNASTALRAAGTVTVRCTKSAASVNVTLGLGQHATGTTRRMAKSGGTDFMSYELYQPSSNAPLSPCGTLAQVWGSSGSAVFNVVSPVPDNTSRTYYVCGQIPAGQDVAIGDYTDTVLATINF